MTRAANFFPFSLPLSLFRAECKLVCHTTSLYHLSYTLFGCRHSASEFGIDIGKLPLRLFGWIGIQNWKRNPIPIGIRHSRTPRPPIPSLTPWFCAELGMGAPPPTPVSLVAPPILLATRAPFSSSRSAASAPLFPHGGRCPLLPRGWHSLLPCGRTPLLFLFLRDGC